MLVKLNTANLRKFQGNRTDLDCGNAAGWRENEWSRKVSAERVTLRSAKVIADVLCVDLSLVIIDPNKHAEDAHDALAKAIERVVSYPAADLGEACEQLANLADAISKKYDKRKYVDLDESDKPAQEEPEQEDTPSL